MENKIIKIDKQKEREREAIVKHSSQPKEMSIMTRSPDEIEASFTKRAGTITKSRQLTFYNFFFKYCALLVDVSLKACIMVQIQTKLTILARSPFSSLASSLRIFSTCEQKLKTNNLHRAP